VRQIAGRRRAAVRGPQAPNAGPPPAVNPAAAPTQVNQNVIGPNRAPGAGPAPRIVASQRAQRPPILGGLPPVRFPASPQQLRPLLPLKGQIVEIPGLGRGTVTNSAQGPGGQYVVARAGPRQYRVYEQMTRRPIADYTRSDNALRAARRAAARTT
jgi:hypothetical protein